VLLLLDEYSFLVLTSLVVTLLASLLFRYFSTLLYEPFNSHSVFIFPLGPFLKMVHIARLCALLAAGHIGVEASAVSPRDELPADKTLRAATKRSDLLKRQGTRIEQKFEAELVYIEGTIHPLG
jgi:hypothetical protein